MTRDLLYVTHRVPYPPDKGDRIRNLPPAPLAVGPGDGPPGLPGRRARRPRSSGTALEPPVRAGGDRPGGRLGRRLRIGASLALRPDGDRGGVLVALAWRRPCGAGPARPGSRPCWPRASSLVPYLRLAALRDVPAVVDLVDVDSQKWLDYAGRPRPRRSPGCTGSKAGGCGAWSTTLPTWARAVTLVSEAEAELYRRAVRPDGPVHAVTNGVDLDCFRPHAAAGRVGAGLRLRRGHGLPRRTWTAWAGSAARSGPRSGGGTPRRRSGSSGGTRRRRSGGWRSAGRRGGRHGAGRPALPGRRRRGRRPLADRPGRAEQGAGGPGDGQGRRGLAPGAGRPAGRAGRPPARRPTSAEAGSRPCGASWPTRPCAAGWGGGAAVRRGGPLLGPLPGADRRAAGAAGGPEDRRSPRVSPLRCRRRVDEGAGRRAGSSRPECHARSGFRSLHEHRRDPPR